MGRKDTLSTEYLSDNARFADICNYCLFDGQDVIRAEDLREMDTKEFLELAALHNIEYAAAKVIEGFTDIKMDHNEKEEFNMCKAWEEQREEGIEQGIEQGRKTEVFDSVQCGDYSTARGAQKLNLYIDEFKKQMMAAGFSIPQ